jgi:hypothetical protein
MCPRPPSSPGRRRWYRPQPKAPNCSPSAPLWPTVPAQLVVSFDRADRDFYADCYERETDIDGKEVWPGAFHQDGKTYEYPPRQILQAGALKQFLADVRSDPDCFEHWVHDHLVERTAIAERFEAVRARAVECSRLVEVKAEAAALARDLHNIMFDIREHVPHTITGILIFARAVAAFEEAQKNSDIRGDRGGGLVLGRELV